MRYLIALLSGMIVLGCGNKGNPTQPSDFTSDPGDTQAPYVEITYPANAQVIPRSTESIKITVAAHDDTGIQGVQIYVNAELKTYDMAAPYTFTIYRPSGGYRVCAKAYDVTGKQNMDCINFSVQ